MIFRTELTHTTRGHLIAVERSERMNRETTRKGTAVKYIARSVCITRRHPKLLRIIEYNNSYCINKADYVSSKDSYTNGYAKLTSRVRNCTGRSQSKIH